MIILLGPKSPEIFVCHKNIMIMPKAMFTITRNTPVHFNFYEDPN